MRPKDSRARYRASLQGEIDSAALYHTLASAEKNPDIAKVYSRLAAIEEAHAEFWRSRLRASGSATPNLRPDIRTRALGWLARRFGPQFVLPTVNTLEQLDSGQYDKQPDAAAAGLPAAPFRTDDWPYRIQKPPPVPLPVSAATPKAP